MALALALALAFASTLGIVSHGTQIPIGPITVRTASLREAMCFSPIIVPSRGSPEGKVSLQCQLARLSSSAARRPPEKHNGYSNSNRIFTVLRMTHHRCQSTATIRVLSLLSPRESSKLDLGISTFVITTVEICTNGK
jgi:hypothetical protein